jgi:hypothetical protein
MIVNVCNLRYLGGRAKRSSVSPGEKYQTLSEKSKQKDWVMAQLIEDQLSKHDSLSSNTSTPSTK